MKLLHVVSLLALDSLPCAFSQAAIFAIIPPKSGVEDAAGATDNDSA
ncbi:MAG: hypothetical protein LBC97_09235 [Bifidobacteriaceae bacterium]|nr:hypothetical protein [Bifidobacteriaceae bacterium]